jgi:hypothetical protein
MARIRNVFEIIELYGHDENFEPHATTEFIPTAAPAGSRCCDATVHPTAPARVHTDTARVHTDTARFHTETYATV